MKSFEQFSIRDYVLLIRRRIICLLTTAVLVGAASAAYLLHIPSVYKSETTILASGRVVPEDYIRSIDRQSPNDLIDFI